MAKPPETPPSSDLTGVDRDRKAIDTPENAPAHSGAKLEQEEQEAKARPKPSRA